jgi:N-acetylglucosaminyldiphosphoundecaprenol N-acetyl-beta-D-mannosaminyltransferase
MMNKEVYLGVSVSPLSYEEIIADLRVRMAEGQASTIIAVNPEKVIAANKDAQLMTLINESTYQIPDGVGVLLASKLRGGGIRSRVTGVDMMDKLVEMAATHGDRVFFYGAKREVVEQAAANLQATYPMLIVAGIQDGYEQDEELVVQRIQEAKADILFVAMGSPKQELWIRRNKERLGVKVYQGVGGSFDVFAGHVKRAPKAFRQLGLEWFYRLASDPKRIKRQMALPRFLVRILLHRGK